MQTVEDTPDCMILLVWVLAGCTDSRARLMVRRRTRRGLGPQHGVPSELESPVRRRLELRDQLRPEDNGSNVLTRITRNKAPRRGWNDEVCELREQGMRETRKLIERLIAMHRLLVWATQVAMFALSGVAAFLLRFDFSLPAIYLNHLAYALPIWVLVKLAVFRAAKLDRGLWRYVSLPPIFFALPWATSSPRS